MKLTPRLEKIASLVPECVCIGDVGTDHAYIPVALQERGVIKKAIASDIVDGPVLNAQKTVERYGMKDRVEVRKGPGLAPYTIGEIQGVIIAGMGGALIADIIDAHFDLAHSLDFLILQPMIGQEVLRAYLEDHNFEIVEEHLETEGDKFYEILKVKTGKMTITDSVYYEVGPILSHKDDEKVKAFLSFKLKKYQGIKVSIQKNSKKDNDAFLKEIEHKIQKLEELI